MILSEYLLHLFYPKDSFVLLRRRGRHNWLAAGIVLAAVIAARLFSLFAGNFLFYGERENVDLLLEVARVLVPFLSFAAALYAVTSVLGGETAFRELFTALSFSLLPYVLLTVPTALLTWAFSLNEAGFYTALLAVKWVWIVALGFAGVAQMNDYSLSKTAAVFLLSALAAALLWVSLLLIAVFCVQWIQFFETVISEIQMLAHR